jgi:hypothetical protein
LPLPSNPGASTSVMELKVGPPSRWATIHPPTDFRRNCAPTARGKKRCPGKIGASSTNCRHSFEASPTPSLVSGRC